MTTRIYLLVLRNSQGSGRVNTNFSLTRAEASEIREELAHYNQQVHNLNRGLAPERCYSDPKYRNEIYQRMRYMSGENGLSTIHLINLFKMTQEEILDLSENLISIVTLVNYITKPWDPRGSEGLGYGLLPATKKLLGY